MVFSNPISLNSGDVAFKDKEWVTKFITTSGVEYLFEILINKGFENLKSLLSLKCLNLIFKLICLYLSAYTINFTLNFD